jgi:hypothetical protein
LRFSEREGVIPEEMPPNVYGSSPQFPPQKGRKDSGSVHVGPRSGVFVFISFYAKSLVQEPFKGVYSDAAVNRDSRSKGSGEPSCYT